MGGLGDQDGRSDQIKISDCQNVHAHGEKCEFSGFFILSPKRVLRVHQSTNDCIRTIWDVRSMVPIVSRQQDGSVPC